MTPEKIKLIKESCARSKSLQHLKATIGGISNGYFEVTIPKSEFTHRPSGIFNGSTISAAVDIASGYAAVTTIEEDCYFSTVEMKINFLNPAKGHQIQAKAKVIKKGKVLTIVQVAVFAQNKEKEIYAATALVTMMRIK